LRFLEIELGHAGFHHQPVIRPVEFRLLAPLGIEIVLADQLLRVSQAGVLSKQGIAAEIAEFPILPEHSDRRMLEY